MKATWGPVPDTRHTRSFAQRYDRMFADIEAGFLGPLRHDLFSTLTGHVVDIGAGTGLSVPHYARAERVDLVEPLASMRERLGHKLAGRSRPRFEVVAARAEDLPHADTSVDAVVSMLVLCSVADVAAALEEVRRVLRPGGTFVFVEHCRAGGAKALLQRALTPISTRYAAGCHYDRDLLGAIEAAGFAGVETLTLDPPASVRRLPEWPIVAGRARQPSPGRYAAPVG